MRKIWIDIYSLYDNYNKKEPFDDALIESIKFHHNAISNYIKDNLYDQNQTDDQNHFYDKYNESVVDSFNFFFMPKDIESMIYRPIKGKGYNLL